MRIFDRCFGCFNRFFAGIQLFHDMVIILYHLTDILEAAEEVRKASCVQKDLQIGDPIIFIHHLDPAFERLIIDVHILLRIFQFCLFICQQLFIIRDLTVQFYQSVTNFGKLGIDTFDLRADFIQFCLSRCQFFICCIGNRFSISFFLFQTFFFSLQIVHLITECREYNTGQHGKYQKDCQHHGQDPFCFRFHNLILLRPSGACAWRSNFR